MKAFDVRVVVSGDQATPEEVAMVLADVVDPDVNWVVYGAVPLEKAPEGEMIPDPKNLFTWVITPKEKEVVSLLTEGYSE